MQQTEMAERGTRSAEATPISRMRNIYFRPAAEAASEAPTVEILNPRYRKINRSPNGEFLHRLQKTGSLEQFPQSVIALILHKHRKETVRENGIEVTYLGTKYQYWSAESAVCANQVDQRVLVTFDPDDMSFIHVLREDGSFEESIPQKNKVSWFDSEAMRKEMREKAHALNRDLVRFQQIHQATTEQKAEVLQTNREKLQIVNTFPIAGQTPVDTNFEPGANEQSELEHGNRASVGGRPTTRYARRAGFSSAIAPRATAERTPPSSPSFPKAEAIQSAISAIGSQRAKHEEREERIGRTRISADDFAAATANEDEGKKEEFSEGEIHELLK